MVYRELENFVWYMVNFEETQWYIMKYPENKTLTHPFYMIYLFIYLFRFNFLRGPIKNSPISHILIK